MATEIKCAIYNDDLRVVNKKPTLVKSVVCRITEPLDVLNPVILLNEDNDILKCNYFVIGHRKYFKVKLQRTPNKMLRIELNEDVISTWLPLVTIDGSITNASEIISENADQDYLLDVDRIISRIILGNNYENVTSEAAIIVQCPFPSIEKNGEVNA